MLVESTKKVREPIAFGLLVVAALYLVSALAVLFTTRDDIFLDFAGRSALVGHVFSDPVLVIALVGAAIMVSAFGEASRNARAIVLTAMVIGAVALVFEVIAWLAGLSADRIMAYGGVSGAGKVVGIFLGLAQLGFLGLALLYIVTIYQSLPKPVKAPAWGQQGMYGWGPPPAGWGQQGSGQQGWGQQSWGQQGWDQGQQAWGQPHGGWEQSAPTAQTAQSGQPGQQAAGGWPHPGDPAAGGQYSGAQYPGGQYSAGQYGPYSQGDYQSGQYPQQEQPASASRQSEGYAGQSTWGRPAETPPGWGSAGGWQQPEPSTSSEPAHLASPATPDEGPQPSTVDESEPAEPTTVEAEAESSLDQPAHRDDSMDPEDDPTTAMPAVGHDDVLSPGAAQAASEAPETATDDDLDDDLDDDPDDGHDDSGWWRPSSS